MPPLGLLGVWSPTKAEGQRFEIDIVHSGVNSKVCHLFTKTPGRLTDFSGVIIWDPENPTKSSVEATIQAASINTNNERRNNHLKSEDFGKDRGDLHRRGDRQQD